MILSRVMERTSQTPEFVLQKHKIENSKHRIWTSPWRFLNVNLTTTHTHTCSFSIIFPTFMHTNLHKQQCVLSYHEKSVTKLHCADIELKRLSRPNFCVYIWYFWKIDWMEPVFHMMFFPASILYMYSKVSTTGKHEFCTCIRREVLQGDSYIMHTGSH